METLRLGTFFGLQPRRQYTCTSTTQATPWISTLASALLEDLAAWSYCCPLLKSRQHRLQTMAMSTTGAFLKMELRSTILAGTTLLVVEMETITAWPSAPPFDAPPAFRVTPALDLEGIRVRNERGPMPPALTCLPATLLTGTTLLVV